MMKLYKRTNQNNIKYFRIFLQALPWLLQIQKSPFFLESNDSDNNSLETLFDNKTGNTFLDNNDKSLTQTYIYKKSTFTHSPLRQSLSKLLALQSQVSKANSFSAFPVLKNPDAQGHIIPQYKDINFFHIQQMKKGCNYA